MTIKYTSEISWLLLILGLLFGCGNKGDSESSKQIPVERGAIQGSISYGGVPPEPEELMVIKDVEVCGKSEPVDERLVVNQELGIKDVVVSLEGVPGGGSVNFPWKDITLNQKGCVYDPHVLLVPIGQKLTVLNPDDVLHNFHTFCEMNRKINISQPPFRKTMTVTFKKPEKIQVRCDVHGWMNAWVVAVNHPYHAITNAEGKYSITGVPPGKYTVRFWQETLGEQTSQVIITADSISDLNFTFPEPANM